MAKYHLRLAKGLSYTGEVCATKKEPDVYTDDVAVAKRAIESGYFVTVDGDEAQELETGAKQETKGKRLDEMNVSELETCAAYYDISLKGVSKKADILKKLTDELGDGVILYGSPAMVDLEAV